MSNQPDRAQQRLCSITLDEQTMVRRSADIEHECKVAVFDLLEENYFAPVGSDAGPYELHLRIEENRLIFEICREGGVALGRVGLGLSSFRRIVKDYFQICESYFQAIKTASPSRIEAIDMGRRGIHNDGSQLLKERLSGKIDVDHDTARRLFTLICILHIRA